MKVEVAVLVAGQCDVMFSTAVPYTDVMCSAATLWRHVQYNCPVECDVMCNTAVQYSFTYVYCTTQYDVMFSTAVQCSVTSCAVLFSTV